MRINFKLAFTLLTFTSFVQANSNFIEPEMVTIPSGTFQMGNASEEDASPVRTVSIKSFKIGKFEITKDQFQQFILLSGYKAPDQCMHKLSKKGFANELIDGSWANNNIPSKGTHPVNCVGFKASQAYVSWLAKTTGKKYRLPTEAEWEYVAKSGSQSKYGFGDNDKEVCNYGNVADKTATLAWKFSDCNDNAEFTSAVGSYTPNKFGVYDMLGNVFEYVQDCEHLSYKNAPIDGSAWIEGECKSRIIRGGAWHWAAFDLSTRFWVPLDHVGAVEGFRIAQDI
ncbi:MAG: formylglycine-generating enzyme family protein [Alteromonadales bacterium]|nr:formylglycine-generating enzyme family protein [Alteromonadales bacterium]